MTNIPFDKTTAVYYQPWDLGSNSGHNDVIFKGPPNHGFTVQINGTAASLQCFLSTGLSIDYTVDGGATQTLTGDSAWATRPLTGITNGCVVAFSWTDGNFILFDRDAILIVTGGAATVQQPPGWGPMIYPGDALTAFDVAQGIVYDGKSLKYTWPDQLIRIRGRATGIKVYALDGATQGNLRALSDRATVAASVLVNGTTNQATLYTLATGLSTAADHDLAVGCGATGSYTTLYSICLVGGTIGSSAPTAYAGHAGSIGDSITAGNNMASLATGDSFDSWLWKVCASQNLEPINRSIGGSFVTSGQANSAVDRFAADFGTLNPAPTIILEMHGANDIHNAVGQSTYVSNYTTLLGLFASTYPSAKIYQFGTINRNDDGTSHDATRLAYNAGVDAIAISAGATGKFNTDGVINPATDTSDGLHPTPAGNTIFANFVLLSAFTVVTPVLNPASGSILTTDTVAITTSTAGAAIHYTTDGSTPTSGSTLYTAPITLPSGSITLKAIGVKAGLSDSAVASGVFTVAVPTNHSYDVPIWVQQIQVQGVLLAPAGEKVPGLGLGNFRATVIGIGGTGQISQAGTWTTTAGSVDANGVATAPAATGSDQIVTLTFTSAQDNTVSGTITYTVPKTASEPDINAATLGDNVASIEPVTLDTVIPNWQTMIGLLIGGTGRVLARGEDGRDHAFNISRAGSVIPGRFVIVRTSGTTATAISAGFRNR